MPLLAEVDVDPGEPSIMNLPPLEQSPRSGDLTDLFGTSAAAHSRRREPADDAPRSESSQPIEQRAQGRARLDARDSSSASFGRRTGHPFDLDSRGGASRTRTGDLLGAIQALSQLSYSPRHATDASDACAHQSSRRERPRARSMVWRRNGIARRRHPRTPRTQAAPRRRSGRGGSRAARGSRSAVVELTRVRARSRGGWR
jgi:hypothetical protein